MTLNHFGLVAHIFSVDLTYITYVIAVIHTIGTLLIGWCIWKKIDSFIDALWFVAEGQLSLGMIGTLIGFVIMLYSAFSGGNDIAAIKESIVMIGVGMGIAIRATLLGLVSGYLIKAQLLLLEKSIEKE